MPSLRILPFSVGLVSIGLFERLLVIFSSVPIVGLDVRGLVGNSYELSWYLERSGVTAS